MSKTNIMRLPDQKNTKYKIYNYLHTDAICKMEVAEVLGISKFYAPRWALIFLLLA